GDLQRQRNSQAEGPGGLEVDDQLKSCRLYHRQVGGFFALEDTTGVDAQLAIEVGPIGLTRTVADQPSGKGIRRVRVACGHRMACRKRDDLVAPTNAADPLAAAVSKAPSGDHTRRQVY